MPLLTRRNVHVPAEPRLSFIASYFSSQCAMRRKYTGYLVGKCLDLMSGIEISEWVKGVLFIKQLFLKWLGIFSTTIIQVTFRALLLQFYPGTSFIYFFENRIHATTVNYIRQYPSRALKFRLKVIFCRPSFGLCSMCISRALTNGCHSSVVTFSGKHSWFAF